MRWPSSSSRTTVRSFGSLSLKRSSSRLDLFVVCGTTRPGPPPGLFFIHLAFWLLTVWWWNAPVVEAVESAVFPTHIASIAPSTMRTTGIQNREIQKDTAATVKQLNKAPTSPFSSNSGTWAVIIRSGFSASSEN